MLCLMAETDPRFHTARCRPITRVHIHPAFEGDPEPPDRSQVFIGEDGNYYIVHHDPDRSVSRA
jgi:hypothetical protein